MSTLLPNLAVSNVVTRSMARAAAVQQTLGQPLLQQARGFANPAFNMSNFGGSLEGLQIQHPVGQLRLGGSRISLGNSGSDVALNNMHVPLIAPISRFGNFMRGVGRAVLRIVTPVFQP